MESSFLGLLHHRTSPTIEMPGMPAGVAALVAASPEGLPAEVEAPEELAGARLRFTSNEGMAAAESPLSAGVAALGAASPEGLPALPAAVEAPEELAAHHPIGLGA